jgi:hypothetical protein
MQPGHIPFWVVLSCQTAMALRDPVRRLAHRAHHGQQDHAPDSDAGLLRGDRRSDYFVPGTHIGVPVSTTHTITGAIVGVGASRRVSAVRWGVAKSIVTAWIVTLPAAGLVGGGVLLYRVLDEVSDTADGKQAGRKSGTRRRQVAALPWRAPTSGALEILLVSSRETRRWVIPKGWPMKGKPTTRPPPRKPMRKPGLTAASSTADRRIPYLKRLKSGAARAVTVDVYPLEVTGEHATWPEKGQRTLQWMSPVEAALAVQEPELRDLIARFARSSCPPRNVRRLSLPRPRSASPSSVCAGASRRFGDAIGASPDRPSGNKLGITRSASRSLCSRYVPSENRHAAVPRPVDLAARSHARRPALRVRPAAADNADGSGVATGEVVDQRPHQGRRLLGGLPAPEGTLQVLGRPGRNARRRGPCADHRRRHLPRGQGPPPDHTPCG